MLLKDTDVRARVARKDKELADAVLKGIGLTISDLIRMAIIQTARFKKLPFDLGLSPESLAAIREAEFGQARRVSHVVDFELPEGSPDIFKDKKRTR